MGHQQFLLREQNSVALHLAGICTRLKCKLPEPEPENDTNPPRTASRHAEFCRRIAGTDRTQVFSVQSAVFSPHETDPKFRNVARTSANVTQRTSLRVDPCGSACAPHIRVHGVACAEHLNGFSFFLDPAQVQAMRTFFVSLSK